MIRVNLMRNRAAGATATVQQTTVSGSSDEQKQLFVKLFLFSFFTVMLMLYEHFHVGQLKEKLDGLSAQRSIIEADLNSKKTEADKLSGIETEAKALEDKLKILRTLSKIRLREVKSLDFIQSVISERVWLREIRYDKEKYTLNGFAIADDDVSEFIKALENSVFFANVILLQSQESVSEQGAIRSFEMTADAEGQE